MNLIFMGTGTSQGVPVIAHQKNTLNLSNPKNWRTRSSVHVEIAGKHIQVDAAPEFRLQCIKNNIEHLDIFILTHGHADHIAGMDDLRRFCDLSADKSVKVYSNAEGLKRIRAMFPYALGDKPAQKGYPCFKLSKMPPELDIWKKDGIKISSVALPHRPITTLGLVFEHNGKKLAYFSDCKKLTPRALRLAKNSDVLVIDALKIKPHPSHMNLEEALKFSKMTGAKKTYLTHTTSQIDYDIYEPTLPKNCHIAYDGLKVEI